MMRRCADSSLSSVAFERSCRAAIHSSASLILSTVRQSYAAAISDIRDPGAPGPSHVRSDPRSRTAARGRDLDVPLTVSRAVCTSLPRSFSASRAAVRRCHGLLSGRTARPYVCSAERSVQRPSTRSLDQKTGGGIGGGETRTEWRVRKEDPATDRSTSQSGERAFVTAMRCSEVVAGRATSTACIWLS